MARLSDTAKTTLQRRVAAHHAQHWPQLSSLDVRWRPGLVGRMASGLAPGQAICAPGLMPGELQIAGLGPRGSYPRGAGSGPDAPGAVG